MYSLYHGHRTANSKTAGKAMFWPVRGFKLQFPLRGYTPYDAPVSSVFDHSGGTQYSDLDSKVIAFNGEIGDQGPYPGSTCYAKADSSALGSGFNYVGANSYGRSEYLCYNGHPGIDIAVSSGTPIYAAANGTVYIPNSFPGVRNAQDYNTIEIDHGNHYKTYYLHLSNQNVVDGQTVIKNETIIGYSGSEGTPAAHLHFEVQKDNNPVDPYGWTPSETDPYTIATNIKLWE